VAHARANPAASLDYIRQHAQELSDEVCAAHIDLYVNEFSLDLGEEGERAVEVLLERAAAAGVIPHSSLGLFAE